MALIDQSPTRANIRIEIKNDFTENMDMDDGEDNNEASEGEVEDGEISDDKETVLKEEPEARNKIVFNRTIAPSRLVNQWTNGDGGFMTGVDIFGKDEKEKLHTRAQRFGLNPNETKSMTDEQLQDLHNSLGITEDDQVDTRFEAIHMYGTQEMSTQDVFAYFGKYGPASIEWINDDSCNVVWHDKVSTARALHGLSNIIDGMPVTGECNPFKKTDEQETKEFKGRSILLVNPTQSEDEGDEQMQEDKENDKDEIIHVSQIRIPVPPGYWRLGVPHTKSQHILLRFAKRTDKKPFKAERFSEYYKKYGNPNFGGIVGLISESKKRKIKVKDSKDEDEDPVKLKGNPWGSLAKNWNADTQEERIERPMFPYITKPSKQLMNRIGLTTKRTYSEDEEDSGEEVTKKSKVPRMRMYADEEEARIKKVKERKKRHGLENIEEKMSEKSRVPDLRSRLGKHESKEEVRKPMQRKSPQARRSTNFLRQERRTEESSSENEALSVQQKSKVTIVVRKPAKPTVASTVWSRLDMEREKQKDAQRNKSSQEDSDSASSKSKDSESDESSDKDYNKDFKKTLSKTMADRPGFKKGDLKSRLGFKTTEHKSPLRIEINNDHYNKEEKP